MGQGKQNSYNNTVCVHAYVHKYTFGMCVCQVVGAKGKQIREGNMRLRTFVNTVGKLAGMISLRRSHLRKTLERTSKGRAIQAKAAVSTHIL